MCKFHADVATDIATDPDSGKFNPVHYAIALAALSHFRLEQYMPSMRRTDAYPADWLASEKGRRALEDAGLERPLDEVQAYRDENIGYVRAAVARTVAELGLDIDALNLPVDPVTDWQFLSAANAFMYDGAIAGVAEGPLTLRQESLDPVYEPLRAAVENLVSNTGIDSILKRMFENSLTRVFVEARDEVDAETSHHSCCSPAKGKAKSAFTTHAGVGFMMVAPHIPCLAFAAIAALAGNGAAHMMGATHNVMMIAAPVISTAGTSLWTKMRGEGALNLKVAFAGAVSSLIAASMFAAGCRDHKGHHTQQEPRREALCGERLPAP